jgi:hypothetical protein
MRAIVAATSIVAVSNEVLRGLAVDVGDQIRYVRTRLPCLLSLRRS